MGPWTIFLASLLLGPRQPVNVAGPFGAPPSDRLVLRGASNGNGGIVLWSASHRGASLIAARRVDALGRVFDGNPLLVTPTGNYGLPAIGWNGTQYLAAWVHDAAIEARTIDKDGIPGPIEVVTPASNVTNLAMACSAGTCVAAWSEGSRLSAAVIGKNALLASRPVVVYDNLAAPELAMTATNGVFLLAANSAKATEPLLSAALIDAAGAVSRRLTVPSTGKLSSGLSAAFTSSEFVVAINTGAALLEEISFRGDFLRTLTVNNSSSVQTIAPWNDVLLAAYTTRDFRSVLASVDRNGSTIRARAGGATLLLPITGLRAAAIGGYCACLDVLGTNIDYIATGAPLMLSPPDEDTPMIAAATTNDTMIVWSESRTAWRLRRRTDGALPELPTLISDTLSSVSPLTVATSGSSYLVTLEDGRGPRGELFFTHPGSVGLQFPGHTSIAAAWDGRTYVVAYSAGQYVAYQSVVHPEIARVDESGRILSTGDSGGPISGIELGIQCGADECINTSELGVAIVAQFAGRYIAGVPPFVSPTPMVAAAPAAFGFIVAINEPAGMHWFHVSPNGTKSADHDPLPSDPHGGISAVRFGSDVLIAWTSPAPRHITGMLVDDSGAVVDGPFAITSSDEEEALPSLTNGWIAYAESTDRYGVPRIQRVVMRSMAGAGRRRAVTR